MTRNEHRLVRNEIRAKNIAKRYTLEQLVREITNRNFSVTLYIE